MREQDEGAVVLEMRMKAREIPLWHVSYTHQMRSLAAGLARVSGNPATVTPACGWSAAEVRAWFAQHPTWSQYAAHFAVYDGEALFLLTKRSQLAACGVLACHTEALLADLKALV